MINLVCVLCLLASLVCSENLLKKVQDKVGGLTLVEKRDCKLVNSQSSTAISGVCGTISWCRLDFFSLLTNGLKIFDLTLNQVFARPERVSVSGWLVKGYVSLQNCPIDRREKVFSTVVKEENNRYFSISRRSWLLVDTEAAIIINLVTVGGSLCLHLFILFPVY